MLSYQHAYHAGNAADVHKHGLLAFILDYMMRKDKPLTYIETHSGRGLYDLQSTEAQKTNEAAFGILRLQSQNTLPANHPYTKIINNLQAAAKKTSYPGSPMIAAMMKRNEDVIHLAEKHPKEFAALQQAMHGYDAHLYHTDGYKCALGLVPPTPRRGMMMIDPSYEIKQDYSDIPAFIDTIHRKWEVGVIALWYPVLEGNMHRQMIDTLIAKGYPKMFRHEITFPKAQESHRMRGSGMFVINAPFGIDETAKTLDGLFRDAC